MTAQQDDPPGVNASTTATGRESPRHAPDDAAPSQSRVLTADSGFDVPLDELVRHGETPLLWSVDERLRLIKMRTTSRIATRNRQVCRLTLSSGRQLKVASTQRVRELKGWKSVAELTPGTRVAALRRVGEPAQPKRMHDSEVIMLAHMIGDGSCIKRQPVRYASIDEANLAAVTIAAAHFGITPIRDEYAAARVATLRLASPYRLTHGKRNPIAEWLDGLGLFGLRSYEKFVPPEIFATPTDQVALFLRHLWATDGSVPWDARHLRAGCTTPQQVAA